MKRGKTFCTSFADTRVYLPLEPQSALITNSSYHMSNISFIKLKTFVSHIKLPIRYKLLYNGLIPCTSFTLQNITTFDFKTLDFGTR